MGLIPYPIPELSTKERLEVALRCNEYYRGVIDNIGNLLGPRSRLSDYGIDLGHPLPARIYELIEELTKQKPAVTVRHWCPKCRHRMNAEGVEVEE